MGYFTPTLDAMVRDPSLAVRSAVAAALTAVLRHDRDGAMRYFQQLCETEELLLATPYVERFIYHAVLTHFATLAPLLERMITSEIPEVATVGARQACVAALLLVEAQPLARRCLAGTTAQRTGAAEIMATNLRVASVRACCDAALIQLFDDPEEQVRAAAATCFEHFQNDDLADFPRLIEVFVQSQAFAKHSHAIISALQHTTAQLPAIICLVCERFLATVGLDAADMRTSSAADAYQISHLLLRAYSQSLDAALHARCLDLIDQMTQMGVYGLEDALEVYNR